MKLFVGMFVLGLFCNFCYGQTLDQTIKAGANEIGQRILKKNKSRIAVADFVNNAGKSDALTKYITEQFENGLINVEGDIQIMDRKHIDQLLSDNKLISDHLIDEKTAKESISFIKVDGWAIGTVTTIGEQIKISIKVIDVTTSMIYAVYTSEMINDPEIKKLSKSTQELNEPKECELNNTGDYCFVNLSDKHIIVNYSTTSYGELNIQPGQTQCLYNVKAGAYYYKVMHWMGAGFAVDQEGYLKFEKCQSKTQSINIK